MKYVFHTAGEIRDAYDFVTNFEGMTFEAENDQAAFDHVSDLSTQEDEKVLAEIEAGRLDKHAYDNLAVLLDYLFRVNDNGTEDNVGAVETGRAEPCRTLYLTRLTDAQKAEFVEGWENAGGLSVHQR